MTISRADGDVRYVPDEESGWGLSSIAHEGRYLWLADQIDLTEKSVLDFGCGSGYGTGFISAKARRTMGVDISQQSIDYAARKYPKADFKAMDLTDSSAVESIGERFDVVVSFDVIEHVEKYWTFVENIQNLLNPGGVAFIGCPNRYATFDYNIDWNEFHFQEFTPAQLGWVLHLYFRSVAIWGQDFSSVEQRSRYLIKDRMGPVVLLKKYILSTRISPILRKINSFRRRKGWTSTPIEGATLRRDNAVEFFPLNESMERKPFGLVAICR